mmetsp:Transcript_399/g.1076  ORF Transcript_399/g.1076 Transcript_399/m.1076 type:complete len:286 (-) Transcript_399:252-1109(-)
MFCCESFFITLATAISKSSCVTCTRRSRSANMPASVQQPFISAPDAPGAEQRRVEDVDAVGGHQHLDLVGAFKPVELVEELKHRALHLRVAPAAAALHARRADAVNLVHEDDGRRVLPRHHEELAHHAGPLADVLLHKLRPRHADESAVCVVGHRAGQQRLARAWGPVQQHTLGLRDTQALEQLRVLDGQLDDLLDLLDLLVEPTDHIVGRIGDLLHLHEADERVHLAREHQVQDVAIVLQRDASGGGEGVDVDALVQVHNVLALRVHLDKNLCLPHDLDHLAHV